MTTLSTPTAQPFTLGVNYWPRRKAMYWWSNFDRGEVEEEFAVIRDLGLTVVRLFLLWDDFQPTPDTISKAALEHLIAVCDVAEANGLRLNITFFTGHMSGPNWPARWMLDDSGAVDSPRPLALGGRLIAQRRYLDPYTDPIALRAEELLIRTVVGALKDHPAVWLWNLGNEADLFAAPATPQIGRDWTRRMVALIREIDPAHPVTFGLHTDSLLLENGLHPDQVYGETDIAVMHGYPMYQSWLPSPLDTNFVPFACALTAALCGKPVMMEEFGGCTIAPGQPSQTLQWEYPFRKFEQFMASEEDLAAHLDTVLHNLVQTGATGALLWCYADYVPELWDRPPCDAWWHERHFGLVRPDGSLKPHAEVIKRFAATKPTVQPMPDWARIPITPDEFHQNPREHTMRLYHEYVARKPAR